VTIHAVFIPTLVFIFFLHNPNKLSTYILYSVINTAYTPGNIHIKILFETE